MCKPNGRLPLNIMALFSLCICKKKKHELRISSPVRTLVQGPGNVPRHIFKDKKASRLRPCQVCHQPVFQEGFCCRVCKYWIHKTCELKHDSGRATKNMTIPNRNSRRNHQQRTRVLSEGSFTPRKPTDCTGSKMDLVYVTERLISLVFPIALDHTTYTRHLRDAAHMLSSKHGENYKVFDLSVNTDVSRFLSHVTSLGWVYGLSPPLELLCSICKALDSWLRAKGSHVAVLHSRSGYERLGIVLAAFLHYTNICASTDQALDRYAMKRFFDDKVGDSLHPSQKRYVQYFAGLLAGTIRINSSPLYLHALTMYGVPNFQSIGGCHLFLKIYQGMIPIYTSSVYNLTETMRHITIAFDSAVQLRGDIIIKAYHRNLTPASREIVFGVQFHTCAVSNKILTFSKQDLDDACHDLRFPLDGGIEFLFSHYADEKLCVVSNVSCDKSPCAITSWDSVEDMGPKANISNGQGASETDSVPHTLGPLDGSLYATVSKRRSHVLTPHSSSSAASPSPQVIRGRYAASIDSGIASNSVGCAPISPISDTSRASVETSSMAPVTTHASRPSTTSAGKSQTDARQLDELLAGMLLDIENIPDLRPNQTPVPDIDSIRCPDLSTGSKISKSSYERRNQYRETISPSRQYNGSSRVNGYSNSDSQFSTGANDVPYHARTNSKPFSYGAVTSSPLNLRHNKSNRGYENENDHSIHINSKETLNCPNAGLESPRLIRRMPGTVGASPSDGFRISRSPSPDFGTKKGRSSITQNIMSRESSPTSVFNKTQSTSRLDEVDGCYNYGSLSRSLSSGGSMSSSWLQNQQKKLLERKEARVRAEKAPFEAKMFSELRSRFSQNNTGREFEDGYISDTTHFSETSREPSPTKGLYSLPNSKRIGSPDKPKRVGGSSAPSSPILSNREMPTSSQMVKNMQQSGSVRVSRKHSDITHDRERPFVVKKSQHSHELSSADGEENFWSSDAENISINNQHGTPGFPPSTPTTPYLNQGLPPKSPTAIRKDISGPKSSSLTHYIRTDMNGHSNSATFPHNRRPSLSSLSDAMEVISSHPKFIKDISKFWYKPNISRDEAITMLKEKSPGTFVVRDSNSFPGAFGLALKVASLPANTAGRSSDPASELVRHFLIEPTSKGVRLKGCANEPVFGSLSALVYQHSITALALPCRLVLPERDPAGSDAVDGTPKSESSLLLQHGAACNVLYLYSVDTESLTGPQALKRAVQLMMTGKPTAIVVHLKVSSQGITLTDHSRQMFFRRHYPINTVSYCGLDPDDRRWAHKNENGDPIGTLRVFGLVAKKGASKTENQCHILTELEPEQPATAICNFINRVMMTNVNRSNLV